MARENKILHVSLFVGLVGVLAGGVADAAVRIGNKTKNDVYRQIVAANAAAYNNQATGPAASADAELPVRVANEDLAAQIQNGTSSVSTNNLESCAKIYPNGEFAWDKPTAGVGAGGASTCVAVVELRGYQMGQNGKDLVLARANVAAGSSIKCNISDFPEISYTTDAQSVVFPADSEPTVADVTQVMNQEQKQNAGLKIAAATLVGAIGGNIAGKNDVGKDSIIGTDKGKMQGTLIGALGGAAIGAGGVYAGKVGGDMIMSTGVNAAAGGVVGNIMASGDSVLRIEDCKKSGGATSKCLWGYLVKGKNLEDGEKAYYDLNTGATFVCKDGDCMPDNLASVRIKKDDGTAVEILSLTDKDKRALEYSKNVHHMETDLGKSKIIPERGSDSHYYIPIESALRPTKREPVLVWGFQDKFFGMKRSDWDTWKNEHMNSAEIYSRKTNGEADGEPLRESLNDIEPMYVSADDGGIIDLNNKARMKETMIGAGAGGALGAFTAYQGAQSDIDERWVSAVREYKDSLQKFYCATGTRFLSYYNDLLVIPNITEE